MFTRKNIKQQFVLSDSNTSLVGIVSQVTESRIAMLLNQLQLLNFSQSIPLSTETNQQTHNVYVYENECDFTAYLLLVNRTQTSIWLKELKEFDFILQIEGEFSENHANKLVIALKQESDILVAGVLPTDRLKGKLLNGIDYPKNNK